MTKSRFLGYERKDDSVGIRNDVLILSTVLCTGPVPEKIAEQVDGTVPMRYGWCFPRKDTYEILRGVCINPNVSGVLIVGLNCEGVNYTKLADELVNMGKECEVLEVRKQKGTVSTIERGVKIAKDLVGRAKQIERTPCDIDRLIMGVKCGGSDATSGLSANPAIGEAVDELVDAGGTVIFSEPLEAVGTEHILSNRAINSEVAKQIQSIITGSLSCYKLKEDGSLDLSGIIEERFMSPGNIDGGITTIEEKSLGAISKSGTRKIYGTLKFAERPRNKGLYFMDSIGHELTDVGVLFGFIAAGAQLLILTTGRGMATGTALAPLIKVCGNPETYGYMYDNMDINAGTIITGSNSIEKVGEEIYKEIISVVNGKLTKAEMLGYRDYEFSGVPT